MQTHCLNIITLLFFFNLELTLKQNFTSVKKRFLKGEKKCFETGQKS